MKKKFKNLFLFVFLVFFAVTTIHSQPRFSFKLVGGFSTIGGGDLNEAIKEQHKLYSDYNNLGFTAASDLDEFRWLTTLKGELIVHLTPNFGIGIGTEYLSKTNKGTGRVSYSYEDVYFDWTESYEYNTNQDISSLIKAVPIMLNLYYYVPVGGKATVFFTVGAAYYFGSLEHTIDYDESAEYTFDSWLYLNESYISTYTGTIEEKAKATSLGFQGGLGIEFDISSSIALVAEVTGRMVNFKNWEGDSTDDWSWEDTYWVETWGTDYYSDSGRDIETGKVWRYTYTDYITDNDYKTIGISEDRPSRADREAEINLNGFQFRIGIRIRI